MDKTILKKIIFLLLIASISYSLPALFIDKNPLGVKNTIESIVQKKQSIKSITSVVPVSTTTKEEEKKITTIPKLKNDEIFPGLKSITKNYLRWIFPHYILIAPFILTIFMLIFYKEIKLISLYLSLFLFVLFSSLNIYGSRSLAFIWPITFILYSFGFWHSIEFINKHIKNKVISRLIKIIAYASVSFFIIINILYSFLWNQYTNNRNDIHIDKNFSRYLLDNGEKNDQFIYLEKVLFSYSLSTPLINRIHTEIPDSAKYLVALDTQSNASGQVANIDKFYGIISKVLKRERKNIQLPQKKEIPANFKLDKEFESIKIYINTLKYTQ
ncbi:MAG: hypothetical protein M0P97_00740 [Candidatus Moranbacteria bacterium]|jgi:hypothetical protein|nr:hypothetical protein [Candidatus Moranbacteria bacterium]